MEEVIDGSRLSCRSSRCGGRTVVVGSRSRVAASQLSQTRFSTNPRLANYVFPPTKRPRPPRKHACSCLVLLHLKNQLACFIAPSRCYYLRSDRLLTSASRSQDHIEPQSSWWNSPPECCCRSSTSIHCLIYFYLLQHANPVSLPRYVDARLMSSFCHLPTISLLLHRSLPLTIVVAFILLLLFASSLGLLPHSALPSTPTTVQPFIPQQSDKALHFLSFAALTITFYFILDTSRRRVLHLTLFICTLLLGVGSEVVQGLLPNGRDFDPWDVLANVLGSLAAVGVANWYHKRAAERKRRQKYQALGGEDGEDLELG